MNILTGIKAAPPNYTKSFNLHQNKNSSSTLKGSWWSSINYLNIDSWVGIFLIFCLIKQENKVFLMHTKLKQLSQGKQFEQFLELWAKLASPHSPWNTIFVRRTSVKLWVFDLKGTFSKDWVNPSITLKKKIQHIHLHAFWNLGNFFLISKFPLFKGLLWGWWE